MVSFLADIAGIAILAGMALAFKRRYINKPAYLEASNPNQEKFMYAMLGSLVIVGYLIEGFRILGAGMPVGEASWAPIGWALASIFKSFSLPDQTLALIYRVLWFYHMVNTMVFVASLGWTKFSHIVMLPLCRSYYS